MDIGSKTFAFLTLGCRDYIAARFLLNNNFYLQGLTLASSAVEKYLKAILISNGNFKKVHLTRLDEIKNSLAQCYSDITEIFDPVFFDLLGKAYKIRYYDDLQESITIGFFKNQFLGELDSFISFIENKVVKEIKNKHGDVVKTMYKQLEENKDEHLLQNNYVFEGIAKKDYMERPDTGFAVRVDSNMIADEIVAIGKDVVNKYEGQLAQIRFIFPENENNE